MAACTLSWKSRSVLSRMQKRISLLAAKCQ